jgi:hypothetical protein
MQLQIKKSVNPLSSDGFSDFVDKCFQQDENVRCWLSDFVDKLLLLSLAFQLCLLAL